MDAKPRIHNFAAGPAVLPAAVMQKVQTELLNFAGTGTSVLEWSHRSPEFMAVVRKAVADMRSLLSIPSNYKVLFMQGGGTMQFSAVVYNLVGDRTKPVDYVVTGVWSEKAAEEAKRLGCNVRIAATTKGSGHRGAVPPVSEWSLSGTDAAYLYYCDNETVHGVEMAADLVDQLPAEIRQAVPVVCDMSSNIFSRPVNVSNYGVIFAGAQKNVGPAGVTLVIVREDLLGSRTSTLPEFVGPLMLDYKLHADNESLYNTPPMFSIYVAGLVFEWLKSDAVGGVAGITQRNARKAAMLYDTIDANGDVFWCPVAVARRSRMNAPFRIVQNGAPSTEYEKQFLSEAEALGFVQLAGHRSVGGIRVSMYNALEEASVVDLVAFMQEFAKRIRIRNSTA
eukprot:jgi/Hompol1/160/HPOL_002137-RA